MNDPNGPQFGGLPDPGLGSGAVDLNLLREVSPEERRALNRVAQQQFQQQGLLCACGEQITDLGIRIYLYRMAMAPTPQGVKPTAALINASFHSRECPAFHSMMEGLKAQGASGMKPICIQDIPDVEWIGDTDFLRPQRDDEQSE